MLSPCLGFCLSRFVWVRSSVCVSAFCGLELSNKVLPFRGVRELEKRVSEYYFGGALLCFTDVHAAPERAGDTQAFLSATFSVDGIYNELFGAHEEELTPEERQRRRQGLAQNDNSNGLGGSF